MKPNPAPHDPIPPELANGPPLISIKQAAADNGCCAGTLKANARARRLRAFQQHFGAPVMVLSTDVEEFLRSRPDIVSVFHPKEMGIVPTSGEAEKVPDPSGELIFPDEEGSRSDTGDFIPAMDADIALRALHNTSPSDRALVAACLSEIAALIGHTIPEIKPGMSEQRVRNLTS